MADPRQTTPLFKIIKNIIHLGQKSCSKGRTAFHEVTKTFYDRGALKSFPAQIFFRGFCIMTSLAHGLMIIHIPKFIKIAFVVFNMVYDFRPLSAINAKRIFHKKDTPVFSPF